MYIVRLTLLVAGSVKNVTIYSTEFITIVIVLETVVLLVSAELEFTISVPISFSCDIIVPLLMFSEVVASIFIY